MKINPGLSCVGGFLFTNLNTERIGIAEATAKITSKKSLTGEARLPNS